MSRERDRNNSRSSRNNHDYLIKLRGFPLSTNKDELKKFLHRKLDLLIKSFL